MGVSCKAASTTIPDVAGAAQANDALHICDGGQPPQVPLHPSSPHGFPVPSAWHVAPASGELPASVFAGPPSPASAGVVAPSPCGTAPSPGPMVDASPGDSPVFGEPLDEQARVTAPR